MSGGDIRTARQARQLLKLPEAASVEEMRRAYRAAVRIAHPDQGGDAASLRAVIDAYRLLSELGKARLHLAPARIFQAPPAAVRPRPTPPPVYLEITAIDAAQGGAKAVALPAGGAGRAVLPPGLRAGDKLRLGTDAGPVVFIIRHKAGEMEVRGNDLWITVPVASRVVSEGGEISVDSPTGRKTVTISPQAGQRGLVRLQGQGLPARGAHAEGHLIVRLAADPALDQAREAGLSARSLLQRFAASWAA
jgi:curved DNA-binding protein